MSPDNNNGRASDAMKADLSEAGTHFRQAAVAAGDALKGVATAAGDEMRLGKAHTMPDASRWTRCSTRAATWSTRPPN
jgi:hypothetical protein